jgi:glycosyltransferase involved in cell wall biosynthesis
MNDKINLMSNSETASKKRILFVITQSEWGGAQKFLYSLISNLDPAKYEIMVSTGSSGDGELLDAFKKINIPTRKLRFLKRQINPIYDLKAIYELKTLIKEFQPNIIFLNSSKAGIIGSLASKGFPNLKVIYRIGGWAFNDPLPYLMRKLYIFAEKCTAKFKDYIIVNNRHDFDQAKQLKIQPRRTLELIYNGIDPYRLEFVEKNEAQLKLATLLNQQQKHFPQSTLIVGTVANFYKTKGLTYLVQAAKLFYSKNPSTKTAFMIIGDGPERTNLEAEIKENHLENKIILVGTLTDAYKYLPAMDIFVLPSVKEGFPWALLEAMSAKLPVIATNVGANPEIIETGKNGFLVDPANPDELAASIEILASDEALRRELGIQAHQTVIKKFDQNKMLEKIESLF